MRIFAQQQNKSQQPSSSARPVTSTIEPSHREHPVINLQRTIGNQAVQRLLQTPSTSVIQVKLTVGRAGDRYEQEADRMAEQVMRMADNSVNENQPQFQPTALPQLQRKCTQCEDEENLQRKETGESISSSIAPPIVGDVLSAHGHPLDAATRAFFEPRFGQDFSRIRIHTDDKAAASARKLGAKAYTLGQHIVFSAGQYSPETTSGKSLLAHELTHTLQQSKAGQAQPAMIQRAVQINEAYEVIENFDPAMQIKRRDKALGRTIPLLNTIPLAPLMNRNQFLRGFNRPTLARRNLDNIEKPDLNDPELDPVRARKAYVSYGQWNSQRVRLVQEALIAWGRGLEEQVPMLPVYGPDGNFKDETLTAVKRFQRATPPLLVDGIVGDQTLGALQAAMNELHGSIFNLETVGNNNVQGKIHVPPHSSTWAVLRATPLALMDNPAIEDELKSQLGGFFLKCPRPDLQVRVSFVDPSGKVPKLIRVHEERHKREQVRTLRTHLVPWDAALEAIKASGRRFRAATPEEATAQIFASANLRNPCDLATDIVQEWQTDNAAFHNTIAGGGVKYDIDDLKCEAVRISLGPPDKPRDPPAVVPARPSCPSPGPSFVVSRDIAV